MKASDRDMLHGPLLRPLLLFTLPIALSSMIQQLFNAADTAVVGYFGDRHALAAVGANTEIVALIVTVSSGLAVGANLLIARQIGQGKTGDQPAAVRTALLLAAVIGVIGLLAGQAAAAPPLRLMRTPEEVIGAASLYLHIYMLGYPFLPLYDFGAAVLRARGDSRYLFFALLLSGAVNVGLNLIFVAGLHMGVAAVTGLSTAFAALALIRRLAGEGRGTSPPQAVILTAHGGRYVENRRHLRRAGCGILPRQPVCADGGQPLRGDRHGGQHRRDQF
mgnify:CR=1 FL=1